MLLFFQTVQNKMLYAATGMTAAELVSGRANALLPMMGMTVVKGKRPTLAEAKTAKNYLNEEELGTLNRLVSAYLDLAELQAMRKKPMYMKDWVARLDDYLRMTDSEVLQNAGKVSHALAEQKAKEEYQKYKRLHSGELSRVEQAFLESVEATAILADGTDPYNLHERIKKTIGDDPQVLIHANTIKTYKSLSRKGLDALCSAETMFAKIDPQTCGILDYSTLALQYFRILEIELNEKLVVPLLNNI